MKKYSLLFLCLIALQGVHAQSVPNAGFETWVFDNGGTYEEPQHWSTSAEELHSLPGGVNVTKSIDAHSGNYAAQISSANIVGSEYGGVLTNGTFLNDHITIVGGSPFNFLPDTIYFYYKYSSAVIDSGIILADFLHHDSQGGRDTIGYAYMKLGPAADYIKVAVPVVKHLAGNTAPDSILMVFTSCMDISNPLAGVLLVDDISFGGPYTGISDVLNMVSAIDVFPNPAHEYVVVHTTVGEPFNGASIYDLQGRRLSYTPNSNKEAQMKIITAGLAEGNYFVNIELANGTLVKRMITIIR